MRYHIGLGIGHAYAQRPASSGLDQELSTDSSPHVHGDNTDMEPILRIPHGDGDRDEPSGVRTEEGSSSEHDDESEDDECGDEEDETSSPSEEEFIIEEDLYEF
jgi:hypothetical protein